MFSGTVMALSAALALSACSTPDGKGKTTDKASSAAPAPTATAVPSRSNDPEAATKAAVLDAYNSFWAEQVKAYAKGDTAGTDFGQYAAAEALSNVRNDVKDLRSKGIVTTGAPSHDVTVEELVPEKKVPYAKLADCLDSTDWKFVYADSRAPVKMPKGRLVRYVTVVEAEKWGEQWKIVTVAPQQRSC
jgi:hypothetical protein